MGESASENRNVSRRTAPDFGIEQDVPEGGGNAARKREHDWALGAGTMSTNGARCPACGAIATTKDIRAEGLAGRLGERMTAVVVEGQTGKEYRLPNVAELDAARERADGRRVANKQPAAWATLVSALIRAGFVVDASWPIRTERDSKVAGGARLSSSIWLVCRRRPATARPGWDHRVLADMQANVTERLRAFWDAVIRGPDFVWAATGPALEAFSRHPVVRKADAPGRLLTVDEFLRRVRRMVDGFVVSRLLDQQDGASGELDDPTTYYLLHRNDFGLAPAPAGACILYALSCNVSDADLAGRLDLLAGGRSVSADEDGDESGETSGSDMRLKTWSQRRARDLGEPSPDGSPQIDCVHKLMQLWKSGEQSRVDAYLKRAASGGTRSSPAWCVMNDPHGGIPRYDQRQSAALRGS